MAERIVLAIDPGPTKSAFVRWDGSRVIECGWVANDLVRDVVAMRHHDETIAIEMIASYGMAVGASVFDTCVEIGRMVQAAEGLATMVFRRDVKLHLCNSARAKDPNVRQALIDRYGEPGTKKHPGPLYGCRSHVWAALGVAVTAWDGAVGTAIVAGPGGSAKVAGGRSKADSNTHVNSWVPPVVSRGSVPSEHPPLETDFVEKGARR